jgi:hypothetical protein
VEYHQKCSVVHKENAKKEQALLEKIDLAKAERNAKARQEEIAKLKNCCLKYSEFSAILVIASPSALDALADKHKNSPKELTEALRDQTRLRIRDEARRNGPGRSSTPSRQISSPREVDVASEAVRPRSAPGQRCGC